MKSVDCEKYEVAYAICKLTSKQTATKNSHIKNRVKISCVTFTERLKTAGLKHIYFQLIIYNYILYVNEVRDLLPLLPECKLINNEILQRFNNKIKLNYLHI